MSTYLTILSAAAPVFIILALGFVLRRTRVLAEGVDESLMRLVFYVLYPALILKFILGNPALEHLGTLAAAPLVGFGTTVLGYALAALAAPLFGLREAKERRTFAFTTGMYNYGYIPIPLIAQLFADSGTTGVLLVHNVGVEAAFWGAGIVVLTGAFNLKGLRRVLNPPVMALVVGLILNFADIAPILPGWFNTILDMLGACAIPLGIIITGASIADLTREPDWRSGFRVPLGACLLRLGLLPLLFLGLAAALPVSPELQRVMIIEAAMPAAMMPIVVSRFYGGDTKVAVQVVLSTTFVSFLTIPLWITLGLALIGG